MKNFKKSLLGCLISIYLLSFLKVNAQEKKLFYNIFSPAYSFSYSRVKTNDTSESKLVSHGLSLNLFRYGYRVKNFEGSGGMSLHFITTKVSEPGTNINLAYLGMAPELRVKYYPLGIDKGIFIGGGGQFFVLPLVDAPNLKVKSLRPMFLMGMTKNYGFSLFCVPNMVSGKVGNTNIKETWYLGMEIDLPINGSH